MKDGNGFPAELAFAGKCGNLVDGGSEVFDEQTQTIDPRIEVHTAFPLSQAIAHLLLCVFSGHVMTNGGHG